MHLSESVGIRAQGIRIEHGLSGRAPDAQFEVARIVKDEQKDPAGPHGRGQTSVERVALRGNHMQVLPRYEIVDSLWRLRGEIPLLERRDVGEPEALRLGSRSVDRHGGEVVSDDRPPTAREPQAVAALAAARIDRATGDQTRGLRFEHRVHATAPETLARAVARVPDLGELVRIARGSRHCSTARPSP